MADYAYRILNVFADPGARTPRLTGNPLCVFEDGRGLDTAAMQALALQFNLSETVFLMPPDGAEAAARLRIFTPAFEMPFAGHPTLGAAHVARELTGGGDRITLETGAGPIPVTAAGDDWTLRANAPRTRPPQVPVEALAGTLGIAPAEMVSDPLWVNTGNEQLVVRLAAAGAVRRCRPDPQRMAALPNSDGITKVYVWAESGDGEVLARFFLLKHGALAEDHGTGSAAANLGGWFVARNTALPVRRTIRQGEPIARPSRLLLDVDRDGGIFVTGRVIELGRGVLRL
ncbi:MAG: PhzF family phenazine biosynthesis protein [Burkholderiales bacterium]|nr:PhzF family phenazine biosynthesis protein [Burkholderiales bacterium]